MDRKRNKIAIVGMACRFPGGADSLESYWKILEDGQDVVSEVPEDRWGKNFHLHPDKKEPGKSYTFAAGVLSQVDRFDAGFFGISPREAEQMDPQQRLLLELTWEALENGGQIPTNLAGSNCAVYVGVASNDYVQRRLDDLSSADVYSMTGSTASIASNRISYYFDFKGPSVSVDTACSSSLVALHQACQSIWSGESSMAITGGVNMLLHPFGFVGFSKASMLSPTGRCQTFDANGDGYVRAEGAAIFFLKPLEQAEADGDLIHAVIVASGINSDGHTNGITVPSPEQQGALLRTVYAKANVDFNDISYLEAHGTGTAVGDPLETRALGEVIGRGRHPDNPLLIGSAKTNVGHLETASGMAGLVKAVLSLKHHAIPPSLNLKTPNPNIDFAGHNLQVVTKLTPLPDDGRKLLIGVNSFGFGGTNAHVLIEDYQPATTPAPEPIVPTATARTLAPLYLSASSPAALTAQALQYASLLKNPDTDYSDIAWTLLTRRQKLPHGLVVYATDTVDSVTQHLEAFAATDDTPDGVVTGQLASASDQTVLVFSGNGSQWQGMGTALFEQSPVFRQAIEEVASLLAQYTDYPLINHFTNSATTAGLELTEIAQPVLFAFQVGAVKVLQSLGVMPAAVVGHSVGEVAAAWASGALSLEQAVQVIYVRSHAQSKTQGSGRMAAAALNEEAARNLVAELGLDAQVEVAGINSPKAVTLSGELKALETIGAHLSEKGTFYRLLDLDYAFHSHHMDSIQGELEESLANLEPTDTHAGVGFFSTVTGGSIAGKQLDAKYWWHNIREPVQFGPAVKQLIATGKQIFVEIGPHPILRSYINECLQADNTSGLVLSTTRRKNETLDQLYKAAYGIHLGGGALDLECFFPHPGKLVTLPDYPWQRERHWYPLTSEGYNLVNRHREHPLLGYRLKDAEAGWENQLDEKVVPYLTDHVVDGAIIVPAAAYVEMALAASAQWSKTATHSLENFEIRAPIMLDGEHAKNVRFTITSSDGSFVISSRDRLSDSPWTVNVVGRLTGAVLKTQPAALDTDALAASYKDEIPATEHYHLTEQVGLVYKTAFQGVETVWTDQHSALARLQIPTFIEQGFNQHLLHPSLLDAGFQILVDIFREDLQSGRKAALIPIQIGKLRFYGAAGETRPAYVQVLIRKQSQRSVVADFHILDERGSLIAELESARFRGVQFGRSRSSEIAAYTFEPILLPRLSANAASGMEKIDLGEILTKVGDYLQEHEAHFQREAHFQQIMPLFDVMVTGFAWNAITKLCASQQQEILVADLLATQNIDAAFQPLVEHLLQILEEDGLAAMQADGSWSLATDADLPSPEEVWLAILGDSAAYLPELVLLGRCGSHLLQVLRGEMDATQLLQAAKSSIAEHWKDSGPGFRAMNAAVREAVRQIAERWPANRRLRILEIGKDAALTRLLLPILPDMQCDYVFAGLGTEPADWASEEFEDYAFLSVTTLQSDLSGDTYKQLLANRFDLVILGNTLHQLDDISTSLPRLKSLLNNTGLLLCLEPQPDRFSMLTAGLEKDWWLPLDSEHQNGKVSAIARQLEPQHWTSTLANAGFNDVQTWFEPESIAETGVYLLFAHAPQAPSESEASPANEDTAATSSWLILTDASGYSAQLAQHLENLLVQQGHKVSCITDPAILDKETGVSVANIIHLSGLSTDTTDNENPLALQEQRCIATVDLVQKLDASGSENKPKLWLITAGAMPHSGNPDMLSLPVQAPLWGLGRVLMNEHPDLSPVLIDLQTALQAETAATLLLGEFLHPDGENEILLADGWRHGLRMQRKAVTTTQPDHLPHVCLDFTSPGLLKHLYWRVLPERQLHPDEIEIRPLAAGLNFRDVMYAMGLLSDEAVENGFAGASLGMELSGQVVRVGADVKDFAVGDEVIGFAPACFSTSVITRTTAVSHKPASWTYEEAATIPTTFFTVYYALHHLAQLEPGDKILIHGASGGVGLAAIQFARYRGAEIFATAGTDEKREFVKLMGADHVLDSRSLKFADDIMALTQGEGIDIVLNSISGEAVNRNLSILKPFGRFLELGKRDFYENNKIGLRPFRNNISYFGIDADQLLIERPALANRLFKEMMELFQEGILRPLPYRSFPTSRVVEAFRYMQQSRQIGKVIVSFAEENPAMSVPPDEPMPLQLSAEGSYLVTGGLSGFGLQTARWLTNQGAGALVLISRSGTATGEAATTIEQLKAEGVTVAVRACDVTNETALQMLLEDIAQNLPPLRGIVHAAMVLDDGIVRNLDAERFRKVLAPKVQGAWNLHKLTQTMPLDFFVMYSSATTYLGNPGQANYVAANMFLESLASHRKLLGLPATYAAWGAIGDTGYLARNDEIKDALQSRLGGAALDSWRALDMLGKLMQSDHAGMAVIDFDWSVIQRVMPAARSPKYAEQQREVSRHDTGDQNQDIMSMIAGMSAAEASTLIAGGLVDEIGKILRLPADKLVTDKSIFDLGMDSLMGMELVLAIEEKFGVRLPVMALTEGATIDKIAEKITTQLLATNEEEHVKDDYKTSIAEAVQKHGTDLTAEEREQLAASLSTDK